MIKVSFLALKVPPLLLFFIVGFLMKILAAFFPLYFFPNSLFLVVLFIAIGSFIGFLASYQFNRQQTTIHPQKLSHVSVLVTQGIYRFSRNPMYLGMAVLLVAWAFYLQAVSSFLGVLLFILYLTQFQIKPEERILYKKFGQLYRNYSRQTRRWL
ncbi:isoprenylcysteine carboxylmethyltransferase family protein [Streptococcus sp. H49]|uniref:methyltransferase family protein n=1 Tax=Streptococcus huangxiaojuni TaxID=3237239 RepID=UPI0034A3F42A